MHNFIEVRSCILPTLKPKVVQAALFVKFNLLHFGDESLIPPSLKEPVKYMYHQDLDLVEARH